ncbi:MAG TPA: hypothetical protein VLG47_03135 [Candidatus Saccharimonadales bacterium]|nr:hypothetical protein [Candidatus Saccharimonadales bacterium]
MAAGFTSESAVAVTTPEGLRPGGKWNQHISGYIGNKAVTAAAAYIKLATSRELQITNGDAEAFRAAVEPPLTEDETGMYNRVIGFATELGTANLLQFMADIRGNAERQPSGRIGVRA